jgi:hypothetical protein
MRETIKPKRSVWIVRECFEFWYFGLPMKFRSAALFLFVLTASVTSVSADLVMVGPNMQFVSSNAVNSDANPSYDVDTAFDGILNSTSLNGAVFNLPAQSPSVWTVNFSNVESVSEVLLHQLVGGISDNGIRDFEITFYAGSGATGAALLSQSFTATLNPNNSAESFELSSTVSNPESFTFAVSSAFGNDARAEFSEVQFNGIVAVPEPSSIAYVLLALGTTCLARRRRFTF